MSEGIRVALPTHGVSDDKNLAFTSESDYLKLDVRHEPKFFDFVTYTFGAAPSAPPLGGTSYTDMLTINHDLGYIPAALVYFYSYNFTGSYTVPNSYQLGSLGITAAGDVGQSLSYSIDSKQLRVYYKMTHTGVDPNATPAFDMAAAKFGIKYFVFANELTA